MPSSLKEGFSVPVAELQPSVKQKISLKSFDYGNIDLV